MSLTDVDRAMRSAAPAAVAPAAAAPRRRRRRLRGVRQASPARYVAIVVVALLISAPLWYLLFASFMGRADLAAYPARLLPSDWLWGNYPEAFAYLSVRTILNTLFVTFGILAVQLVLAIPFGFALARLPLPGSTFLIALLIVPNFIPGDLTLIPTFLVTYKLGLLNTFGGIILPIAAQVAFGTLLFRQAFIDLPHGIVEAARLDGANWLRLLVSIAVPLIGPAIAAYSSITFLGAWNQYIWPQLVANDTAHQVLNTALAPLATSQYSLSSPGVSMAAAVIAIVPVLAVFIATQRWYVQGLTGSGVE